MRHYFSPFFLCVFIIMQSQSNLSAASHQLMPRGSNPNKMILFCIDNQDYQLDDPIAETLLAALYQVACPVVVSKALLRIILLHKLYNKDLYQKFKEIEKRILSHNSDKNIPDDLLGYSIANILALFNVDLSKWTFYEVNHDTYLLIPTRDVLKEKGSIPVENGFSQQEFLLGLKIDHLRACSYEEVLPPNILSTREYNAKDIKEIHEKRKFSETLMNKDISVSFIESLANQSIFVSQQEYSKYNQLSLLPQWTVCFRGHGGKGTHIARLTIKDFRKMLDILSTKLLMRLLIVYSCFAAGTNAELAYADADKAEQYKIFPFPIIISALPDLFESRFPTEQWAFTLKNNQVIPQLPQKIDELYAKLQSNNPIEYAILTSLILSNVNFPYIRFPERDHFVPLFPAITIGTVMANTRTEPLQVKNYTDKVINKALRIILDTTEVPFSINFSGISDDIKIFLASGISGLSEVLHTLEQVVTDEDVLSFLKHLTLVPALKKVIRIAELKTKNQIYKDVILAWNKQSRHIFAQYNDIQGGMKSIKFEHHKAQGKTSYVIKELDDDDKKLYSSYTNQTLAQQKIDEAIKMKNKGQLLENIKKIPINKKVYFAILKSFAEDADLIKKIHQVILDQFMSRSVNDTSLVIAAIKNGADANQIDLDNHSVLIKAVQSIEAELVGILLENGANIHHVTPYKETALSTAQKQVDFYKHVEHHANTINAKAILKMLEEYQKKSYQDISLSKNLNELSIELSILAR